MSKLTLRAALRRALPSQAALLLLCSFLCLVTARPASAAPTSIVYTGQLLTSTSPPTPANGSYDFQFQLFNAATGGTQVGPTVSLASVPVVDGIYQVQLSFGNVFTGQTVWLQVSYRVHPASGSPPYTALSPRQVAPNSAFADYATLSGSTQGLQTKAVSAAYPTTGQVLTYNGTLWAPATPSSGGGTYTAGTGLTLSGNQFSVAVPLALSGSSASPIFQSSNTSAGTSGSLAGTTAGVYGAATSGGTYGVYGTSSTIYTAVVGQNLASGDGVDGINIGNGDSGFLGGVDPKYSAPAGVCGNDAGSGNGVLGLSSGGTGSGVSGVSDGGFGVLGVSTNNDGMQGQTSENGHSGVSGVNNGSGHGVFGVSRSSGAYGFLGGTDPQYNAPAGVFGTNTTNSGNGVLGIGTSSTGVAGVSTSGDGVYASVSSASGTALYANNTASGSLVTLGDQDGDGVYAYAASGKSAIRCDGALNVNGHASVHVLQITGGSDVAEPYAVNAAGGVSARPGLVVSIDPDHTGQMTVSRRAYDHAVAGILSGAGGVQAGLTLRQSGTVADGALPVACTGRVWCWCDAGAGGAISPGDLLTTSDTPGHAMKAGGGSELRGAILGKAMSSLKSGKGLVLVLVTLE